MRITVSVLLLLGLVLCVQGDVSETKDEDESYLNCLLEDNTVGCLSTRLGRNLDEIEVQVTGKSNETPMSAVIEQAGNFVAEVIDDVQNPGKSDEVAETADAGEQEEGRGKKFGKKKKKQLQRLLGLVMLFKAKLSLLLQLISTHFQLKFFFIAVITLALNVVKFWLDLKKSQPAKVIYYEHAQHQHHYDHDDYDHSWGRSSNDSPQDLAYSAYTPKN